MAARRMFARAVVGSGLFLRLPVKSRLLYYDLGMDADDDGAVDVLSVLRKTGATDKDLEPLVDGGFVAYLLREPPVVYISDWKRNNLIRKDRYTEGLYRSLVEQYTGAPLVNQRLTNGQPMVNPGQDRTGQAREGQDRTGQGAGGPAGRAIPLRDEVLDFFQSHGVKSELAERFWSVNEGRNWTIDGGPVKNWRKLAEKWIEIERKEASQRVHGGGIDERSPDPGGWEERFARHILR